MLTATSAFESISLEQSTRPPPPPDEPDPADFLSQSPDLRSSYHDQSPAVSLNGSTLHESLAGSVFREPLFPKVPGGGGGAAQSPLEHLLARHESLGAEMAAAITRHRAVLASGDDCSASRAAVAALLAALGENSLSLHEVYTKERALADSLHSSFVAWDKKRAKVLRRVAAIRSERSAYGAKLDGLLGESAAVDDEIAACEARLAALRAKKAALGREVGETVSVLESKSAKYVSLFRSLEVRGADAISDYLQSSGVSESDTGTFLRYEPVMGAKMHSSPTRPAPDPPSLDPSDIGVHALEIPDSEMHSHLSPYEKGYAKGAKQFQTVKSGLATLVHTVFSSPPKKSPPRLEDSQNSISEKVDVEPILDLLFSKSAGLMDLIIETSKMAENFHQQTTVWKDAAKFLEAQEDILLTSLSQSGDLQEAQRILLSCHDHLQKVIETHASSPEPPKNFLGFLLRQELYTVSKALDQISGSSYTKETSSPDLSKLEPANTVLHSPMTFISSEQLYSAPKEPRSPRRPVFTSSFGKSLKKE